MSRTMDAGRVTLMMVFVWAWWRERRNGEVMQEVCQKEIPIGKGYVHFPLRVAIQKCNLLKSLGMHCNILCGATMGYTNFRITLIFDKNVKLLILLGFRRVTKVVGYAFPLLSRLDKGVPNDDFHR